MSLSGFDSGAVGFDSVSQTRRQETTAATQTSEFEEAGVGSQTSLAVDAGSMVTPSDLGAEDDVLKEYPPPGLNDFLRRVVPAMLEQLDQNEQEVYNSSDSEDEEVMVAKLIHEGKANADVPGSGSGDHQTSSILSLSWSGAGSSLCAGVGRATHERWCEHEGLLRVYSARGSGELQHLADVADRSCVTVVKYHPSVAALLAYGTSSGEVVVCNLRDTTATEGALTTPPDWHGGRTVTSLLWADAALANIFLTMQILSTGKRRGASDQILISAGCDGTVNIWQVNVNHRVLEGVVSYSLNAAKQRPAPDISCVDFIRTYPLRPSEEKVAEDVFIVGTTTGDLLLCGAKGAAPVDGAFDPVVSALQPHGACVLDVAFSLQKPGVFASLAANAELRMYSIDQPSPLKVLFLDAPVSCMSWLPNSPAVVAVGVSRGKQLVRLYHAGTGRRIPVDGLDGSAGVTAISVTQSGSSRIACGDSEATVRVWELPPRRFRLTPDDLNL